MLIVFSAQADDGSTQWALCRPAADIIPLPELGALDDPAMQISAERGDADRSLGQSYFSGHVVMLQSGRRIESDEAHYDQTQDLLTLDGQVWIYTDDLAVRGSRGQYHPNAAQGELHDANYLFRSLHASGQAERIMMYDGEHTELTQASYSTCDPDKVDWQLQAQRIRLDESTNTGEAYHVTLEFKGVPFLYTPYINFPLKGRKTGFLMPSIGGGNKTGTDISLPWYWNIAPNYDATLIPRYMSKRGTQLGGEFRYLHPNGQGQLKAEILPDDSVYDGKDRYTLAYRHGGYLGAGWDVGMLYNKVSDLDYFNDLGSSLMDASTTHLERRFDLGWRGEGWNFLGRVQDYQTLYGVQPYTLLPRLQLNAASPRRVNTLRYALSSEYTHFTHRSDTQVTGDRLDLMPEVSLPLRGAAWFFTPRLALRHTQYQLQNTAEKRDPSRSQPIASVDSGLFFERELSLADRSLLQTLEPRLFYLYVPYRDQDELPNFDSGEYDFSFSQLFRDNRYSGADRQSDANQLTLALTSRLLDARSGRELLRGSLGQIRYFSDRRANLANHTVESRRSSDFVVELGAKPLPKLDLSAAARWNPKESQTELLTGRARYAPDNRHLISLDYRYRRGESLRQTDMLVYWPIGARWRVLGRWNYDLELKRNLETVAGLAWEDCCWGLHFALRRQLDTVSLTSSHSFMITLELKGLSSLGARLEDELRTIQTQR